MNETYEEYQLSKVTVLTKMKEDKLNTVMYIQWDRKMAYMHIELIISIIHGTKFQIST